MSSNDQDTDREFTVFCLFHAAAGCLAILLGNATTDMLDPARFEQYGPIAEFTIAITPAFAMVAGTVLFAGSALLWLVFADADPDRKRELILWRDDDA
ncbi:hypothetical protein HTZ84_22290 [Haloterrigena sp. SYSU A558-1]|uniref:Uncharacterized protein n=1 Tax=Haloterrigena gelatinilytica TaxID=2741724 RepID=A0ABX2LFG1_9EURY|nr:hypothetical protein [Haloterrigena gelatinilytica]NUC74997.1 hypothetical protein [Haloterrigena gelatinilytica]